MGNRQSTGAHRKQTERETGQQKAEELGRGRGGEEPQETEVLKILYTNAQSILGKLNELSAYVSDMKPDFILLTESWCNPSVADTDLTLPGYQLEQELRKDRTDTNNGIGGGLLVYSRNGHKVLPMAINNNFHQHVSFKILTSGNPVTIMLLYRPPSSVKENITNMCDLLRNLPRNTIVIGDINLPHIDWTKGGTDAPGRTLYDLVQEEDLAQLVHFPTHDKGNILDLIITNMANDIISVNNEGKLGKSDHCIIMTEVLTSKVAMKMSKVSPNWSKADFHGTRCSQVQTGKSIF